MKKTVYQLISMSALVLLLSACGAGIDDNSGPNEKRVLENQKLTDEYTPIQGVYDGTYTIASEGRQQNVKLYLFLSQVQEQTDNQNLKPGLRVVLKGRLMQTDVVGDSDNVILEGQYESTTGQLRLDTNSTQSLTARGCRLGGNKAISVEGTVHGDTVTANIENNGQTVGQIVVKKNLNAQSFQAGIVDEDQEFQRLQNLYKDMIGSFTGTLRREGCSSARTEKLTAWVYLDRVAEGTGNGGQTCYVPKLTIRTSREYDGDLADMLYVSNGGFDPQSYSPQFQTRTLVTSSANNSYAQLQLRTKDQKNLTGVISTTGTWGTFSLKKTATLVKAPADEYTMKKERITRTLARFVGNYTGQVVPAAGSEFGTWPVNFQVRMQNEAAANGEFLPVLHGLYTRPDFSDSSIGRKDMKAMVSVDSCQTQVLFRSDATYNNGAVTGIGKMDFPAVVTSSKGRMVLKGDLSDHRGYLGVMTVIKTK